MATRWYIAPYKRNGFVIPFDPLDPDNTPAIPIRVVALYVDFPQLIGQWDAVQTLGNRAVVKVNASPARLLELDAAYYRLPDPDTLISNLPNADRIALQNELSDMGYSPKEISDNLPNPIGTYRVRAVLKFMARRWLKPNWNKLTDTITFDGAEMPGGSIDVLDRVIT